MDAILSPTRERLAKGAFDAPVIDQKVERRAYMAVNVFITLYRADLIEQEHVKAAEKFCKHYEGALGFDVRYGDETGHPDCEEPRTYHAQMITKACDRLTPSQCAIMVCLTTDPKASLEALGRRHSGYSERRQAKAAATAITREALEQLCLHWGIKSRDSP